MYNRAVIKAVFNQGIFNAANKAVIKALWDVLASQKRGRAM
jgi:hypothetical protein